MHFEKDDIPPGFGMLLGRNETGRKGWSVIADATRVESAHIWNKALNDIQIESSDPKVMVNSVYWITILWIKIPAVADSSDLKRSPVECSPPG